MKYVVEVRRSNYGYIEVEADSVSEAEHKATQLYLENLTRWTDSGLDFSARPVTKK